MTSDWSFEAAREPARFAACRQRTASIVEHAFSGTGTLCGIAAEEVEVYRHLFALGKRKACRNCAKAAAAAPMVPCGQERLHDVVVDCASSPMRDELLEALQHGAEIEAGINGPACDLAIHVPLDDVTEGKDGAFEALSGQAHASIARVRHGGSRFLVVAADGDKPIVARLISRSYEPIPTLPVASPIRQPARPPEAPDKRRTAARRPPL